MTYEFPENIHWAREIDLCPADIYSYYRNQYWIMIDQIKGSKHLLHFGSANPLRIGAKHYHAIIWTSVDSPWILFNALYAEIP